LASTYAARFPDLSISLNQGALVVYESLGDAPIVPPNLLTNIHVSPDEEHAMTATNTFSACKSGYADTRFGTVEEETLANSDHGIPESDGSTSCADNQDAPSHNNSIPQDGYLNGVDEAEIVVDMMPNPATINHSTQQAVRMLKRGGVLASSTASTPKPFSDYDWRWPLLVHAAYFPNGTGGAPKGMSLKTWIKYLLHRRPPKQASNIMLVLHMFNVLQRHDSFTQAHFKLRGNPDVFEKVGMMTNDEIKAAGDLLGSGKRGKAYAKAMAEASPVVRVLVRSVHNVGKNIAGSPASFASLRSRVIALWHALGEPTTFCTFNPSELNHPAVMELTDHNYGFKHVEGFDYILEPDDTRPNAIQRWHAVASDPVADALFFHSTMTAICSALYGWPLGNNRQNDPSCPFGQISAHYFRLETSGRGAIHAHGQITQCHLQARNIRQLQQHDCTSLQAHVEGFSRQYLPDPWFVQGSDVAIEDNAAHIISPSSISSDTPAFLFDAQRAHAALSNTPQLSTTIHEELTRFIALQVASCQIHKHHATCMKGGRKGGDLDCRMVLPRPTHHNSAHIGDTGNILFRRDHRFITHYMPALMLAQPMNHMIIPSCDASRWDGQVWRANQTHTSPPALQPIEVQSAHNAEYACKYSSKAAVESLQLTKNLLCAETTVAAEDLPNQQDPRHILNQHEEIAKKGRRTFVRFLNAVNTSITIPAPLAAMHLLGFNDQYVSHKTCPWNNRSYQTHWIKTHFPSMKDPYQR
jgi:hypothetical protein